MPRLRVAAYNIAGAINRDSRFYSKKGNRRTTSRVARARRALDRVADLLRDEEISICALQEVDICHNGRDTLDQRAHLTAELDMQGAYAASFEYDLFGRISVTTGLATIGAFDLVSANEISFSQRRLPTKRRIKAKILGAKKALHTTFRISSDCRIDVVNVHLTHDNDRQKECELETVLDYCSKLDTVLLMGDLNATPAATRSPSMVEANSFGSDRCMEILARFRDRHRECFQCDARLGDFIDDSEKLREICTYPSESPSLKLDYILLFSRDQRVSLAAEELLPLCISNHRAVAAELIWAE